MDVPALTAPVTDRRPRRGAPTLAIAILRAIGVPESEDNEIMELRYIGRPNNQDTIEIVRYAGVHDGQVLTTTQTWQPKAGQ